MNLIDESFSQKEQKNTKKTKKILLISIIILVILMIGICITIAYMQNANLKVYVDGKQSSEVCSLTSISEDGTLYFPIKEIAKYFSYESFNGEYKGEYETQNKCYVKCENEIANFSVNSDEIYKLEYKDEKSKYEKYIADKDVIYQNDALYASADAIQKAFNVSITYNSDTNRIYIYTMPYLITSYTGTALNKGYKEVTTDFNNQKAILEDEIVVKKDDKTYAVINTKGTEILEAKYDKIEYIPETGDFLVTVNEKVGIMKIRNEKAETKISASYTNLELIDTDTELYLAQKDDKYGVIDSKENKKIYIEYDKIGIDASNFEKNDIKNNYLLANNLILVQKDKYWAVFNKKGKQLTEFKYDSFGYLAKTNKDILSLLLIPDYNVLVACKDKKYILVDSTGEELFNGASFDDIYMVITSEKTSYKLTFNSNTYDVIQLLKKQGVTSDSQTTTEDELDSETTNSTSTNQTTNKNETTENSNERSETTDGTEKDSAEQEQENEGEYDDDEGISDDNEGESEE